MPELSDVEAFKQYMDATRLDKTTEKVEVKSPSALKLCSINGIILALFNETCDGIVFGQLS